MPIHFIKFGVLSEAKGTLKMTAELVGFIGILILFVLLFLKVPIGIVMTLVGFFGYSYLAGWDKALQIIGMEPHAQTASYTITALPLFLLLGTIVSVTGISKDLYYAASKWIGHLRGGLAMATVGACGLFAAVCGNSMAGIVTMGKIAYPEMKRYNYHDGLALGIIASGGTVGLLIPPSLGFILYGILTEQSIGHLFMAGIIPGVLECLFYMITIYIICRINPRLGPPGPNYVFREKMLALKEVWPIVLIFLVIIGGIYMGVFTPTEAGAIGSFVAFIFACVLKRVNKKNLWTIVTDTSNNTAMILFFLIGAFIFMRFIALSNVTVWLSNFIVGLNIPGIFIIILILMAYIVLGCFMDSLVVLILTISVVFPTIVALGYNPIWWGVVMIRILEIGLITPPFGLNLFVLSKLLKVPLNTVYRGVAPFVISDFLHLSILVAFPEISLFLVKSM